MAKYFNATNAPIRYDHYGHIVGGAEWFESKSTPEIRKGIENGDIVEIDADTDPEESSKSTGKK